MQSIYQHIFIYSIVVLIMLSVNLVRGSTELKDRFLNEAPQRWEDYLRFGRHLQVTIMATHYDVVNDKRSEKLKICSKFKQTEGAALRVYQLLEPKGEEEAEGTNPTYSFQLKRRDSDQGWLILGLNKFSPLTTLDSKQSILQEDVLHDVCSCLKLWNLWLPTLVHDSDFKIKSIYSQNIDGVQAIHIDFEYLKRKEDYPLRGALPIKGGWMLLAPEQDWILREYVVHSGDPENSFIQRTFYVKQDVHLHPIITQSTTRFFAKGESPPEMVIEAQYETLEKSDVPLAEFTLSAFGLTEPFGTAKWLIRWHRWIALTGIICLVLAALLRWRVRRTRNQAAS